ncbi:MAG: hypothetical protein HWD59_06830 [Coxiellaceae bacterium]|nr:MAG: hypothetical protein HWD59_06830 [Coxiellaceae bacterium]
MAEPRVADFIAALNQHIVFQETIAEHLSKIEALINVALDENFLDQSQPTIHDYLWTVGDIVRQARGFSQLALDFLLKTMPTEQKV